jgi:CheY-like chemotaxis protein
MVTSLSAKRYIDGAFAAGATDYLTKPLDRLELKARIGMAERLVEERLHVELLTRQAGRRNEAAYAAVEFESAIHIPEFDRGIELLALENYLLTLGRKGTLSMSAIAFHIENANVIFGKATRSGFVDMLSDVGLIISDALKTDDIHLAYAGSGNFVGVTAKGLSASPDEISAAIEIGLADFESFYSSQRLPTPRVRVGPLCKSPMFSLGNPTRILERAVQQTVQRSGRPAHAA